MVKAVHMTREGKVEIVEHSLPTTLEAGAVLIKTSFSEVCGTDVHLLKGHLAGVPYPIIPGHVSTGIIEDLNLYYYHWFHWQSLAHSTTPSPSKYSLRQ